MLGCVPPRSRTCFVGLSSRKGNSRLLQAVPTLGKPNPGTLPPCEAWLQANHYGDKGWSFEVILYSEQISRLKAADPNDLLVGVPSSELKFTIDSHRFYPIYTPLADIEHHGDLVCDDPSGVMVTSNASVVYLGEL